MIIHHVCKIISGESVGFDQNHIIKLRVVHGDVPVYLIMKGSGSFGRIVLADDIRHSCRQIGFYLFSGKMKAVLVISHDLLAFHSFFKGIQSFLGTEAVISLSFFHQLFRIFQINAGGLSLTLYIRTYAAILVRTFVMVKPCFF